jgi:hypothetical protein
MHQASLAIIAIPLILLAATVAISALITEDAFARDGGRYSGGDGTSQAAAVSNECLNPILDSNSIDNMVGVGNCGGTVSQQDESGQAGATTTHQTASPTIELQRATSTTQPPLTATPVDNCVACFSTLTTAEQAQFLINVKDQFPTVDTTMGFSNAIEELCKLLEQASTNENLDEALELLDDVLTEGPPVVDEITSERIQACIIRAL